MTEDELKQKGYVKQGDGSWTKPDKANRVASTPVSKQGVGNETVEQDERKPSNQGRRLVRITSFRTRECDERNLFDKYFTDALVQAGILFDDSPTWCKIIVEQEQVQSPHDERTEIEVFEM